MVGSSPGQVKPKTLKLVRGETGWLRIGIMCPSEATCLPVDCCFSELAL